MVRIKMSPISVRNQHHVGIHAVCIILANITQVITYVFSTLTMDNSDPNTVFQNSARNVSETFPLEVTMDWWSDLYWHMIDLWSMFWLCYPVIGLVNRKVNGRESCHPEIHPPEFYLMWTMICISRIFSMSLWGRHFILGAVLLRWTLPLLSFYMLYMSHSNLDKHKAWLSINHPAMISWTRYLTQNGLAVFAWWTLLNSLVDLGIVIKYNAGVPDPLVSTVVLSLVSLCAIIWLILQSFLLTKYLRHTFGVYTIIILGLGAMFTRSYRLHDLGVNTVFCGFLMLLMTILSIIHLISACLGTEKSSSQVVEPHMIFVKTVCQAESNPKNKLYK